METKPAKDTGKLIPVKRPTPREWAAYFFVGALLALIVIGLTVAFDRSTYRMVLTGMIVMAIYIVVATPLLLARRA
ncbi:MAG: hypothetical protein ACRDH9_00740 [Actinomycetota bacterium]